MTDLLSFTFLASVFASTVRLATPLIFASLGGYTSERSGIWNIALEGLMLIGAFFSAVGALYFQNPFYGIFVGCLASVSLAALHGLLCITLRANAILSGFAINLLAAGLTPVLSKAFYDSSSGTPQLDSPLCVPSLSIGSPMIYLALALGIFMALIHSYHWLGQYIRFSGEHPEALRSQGIRPEKIQWIGVLLSGVFCGLAGAYLAIDHGTSFSRNMTAGRGFIALAALIMGRYTPLGALFCALIFGAVDAVQILLQGTGSQIPTQWLQSIPYIITIFALALSTKARQTKG